MAWPSERVSVRPAVTGDEVRTAPEFGKYLRSPRPSRSEYKMSSSVFSRWPAAARLPQTIIRLRDRPGTKVFADIMRHTSQVISPGSFAPGQGGQCTKGARRALCQHSYGTPINDGDFMTEGSPDGNHGSAWRRTRGACDLGRADEVKEPGPVIRSIRSMPGAPVAMPGSPSLVLMFFVADFA